LTGDFNPETASTTRGKSERILANRSATSVVLITAEFFRTLWQAFLAISAILLVPCLWHRHVVASDLGSHLYNAWLAHLIRNGQAPGLWLARQSTNILFDYLLSGFGAIFGFMAAEKIAVGLCVLIFFWGIFAMASAATGRAPWFLLPVIALFAYGWTFHVGFFNYYLSIGLAFLAVAILWRGTRWEWLIAIALAGLSAMAHPFGLLWLVCAIGYIALAERLPSRFQWVAALVAAVAIVVIHYFFLNRFCYEAEPDPIYWFSGGDQLVLFGHRYWYIKWAVLIFSGFALAFDVIVRRREKGIWRAYSIPLQLYLVIELAVFLFPRGVEFPHRVAIAMITERLTSLSAAAGCCLLAVMQPRKWHLAVSLAIAAVFFAFVYQDTGTINQIEQQAEALVRRLPPDQRVLATLCPLDDSRVMIQHIVDLACIGHCFSYGNYEAGTEIFRVRAKPGNPYLMSSHQDAIDMEDGNYVLKASDLPAYQMYQCTPDGTRLCIRPLVAGEKNNRLGVYEGQDSDQ